MRKTRAGGEKKREEEGRGTCVGGWGGSSIVECGTMLILPFNCAAFLLDVSEAAR